MAQLGIKHNLFTAYYPQTDEQTKRMLRDPGSHSNK